MKKKLFQIGFILLLATLVSTGINFSLKKNQSNFSLGVANIEALATGEIDVNIDFSFKEANYFYCRCRDLDGGSARCTVFRVSISTVVMEEVSFRRSIFW